MSPRMAHVSGTLCDGSPHSAPEMRIPLSAPAIVSQSAAGNPEAPEVVEMPGLDKRAFRRQRPLGQ
jgi:hypothetical protein